jgi:hypothetical protein
MNLLFRTLSSVALLIMGLTACGGDEATTSDSSENVTATAATAADSPEVTAVKFFEAIYLHNDIKEAKSHATPSMQRVLSSYSSGKAVARTLLNMSFDEVEITIEDTNKNVREFYTDKAEVMLIFTGKHDGNKQANMRMVKLVKQDGKWMISEIKNDPFARTKV